MDNRWYVSMATGVQGPFTPQQIQAGIASGVIFGNSQVSPQDKEGWVALSTIPELALYVPAATNHSAPRPGHIRVAVIQDGEVFLDVGAFKRAVSSGVASGMWSFYWGAAALALVIGFTLIAVSSNM